MKNKKLEVNKEPSVIRGLFEYAKKRKEEIGEDSVFDFSLGNPNVPAPKEVNDALIEILKTTDPIKLHGYSANTGMPEVKKEIAKFLAEKYHADVSDKFIYITCGASAGIVFTIHSCLDDGGEAILFAPYFPEYTHYIIYAGGKYVVVKPTKNFEPDLEDFKKKISRKTKLVIMNSPNNPSGAVYSEDTIKKMSDILVQKEKEYGHPIYLLSDEPYRELIFRDGDYPFIPNYYDDAVVSYSYSKSLSIPGERIGYLLVSPKAKDAETLFKKMTQVGHNLGYVSTPSLFQLLLPKVIGLTSDIGKYKANRDNLYKMLTDIGFEVFYPEGAFYMLVKAPDGDANRFSELGKKHEIIMVPTNEFGLEGYVRLAYSVNEKVIKNSKEAFEKLFKCYGGK